MPASVRRDDLPAGDAEGPFSYEKVNVAAAGEDPRFLSLGNPLPAAGASSRARRCSREDELVRGRTSKTVLAYWRVRERAPRSLPLQPRPAAQSVSLDLSAYAGKPLVDLLAETEDLVVNRWPLVLNLEPFASHWLEFG
jgi:hypothetical protein